MIDLIILLIINGLLCLGFWNACLYESQENIQIGSEYDYKEAKFNKGVLWWLEKWGSGKWYYKPIGGCLPCMASLHSIYPYWTYMYMTGGLNWNALIFYPVYVIALSGFNYLLNELA